jgi:SAM-dependent methyltransferase
MKSPTDRHWSERAASVKNDAEVNLMDLFQRDLEYDHVCRYLDQDMTILEVGCGNGFSTNRFRELVKHVDAFDYSETMIARAREVYGERNNRFVHDNILAPRYLTRLYDAVLCIRVLINLRDLTEQRRAIHNMVALVRPGGRLVLVEGFREGFSALSALRAQVGLPAVQPASINVYSEIADLVPEVGPAFEMEARFHLGAYDYLTRVVYPLIVGADRVQHNTVFSERCGELARAFNPESFAELSRVHGFVFRRQP